MTIDVKNAMNAIRTVSLPCMYRVSPGYVGPPSVDERLQRSGGFKRLYAGNAPALYMKIQDLPVVYDVGRVPAS